MSQYQWRPRNTYLGQWILWFSIGLAKFGKPFLSFPLQLVPAVTELVIAELLYLQYSDPRLPTYVYVNSTGTSRADGETVSAAFHTSDPVGTVSKWRGCSGVAGGDGNRGLRHLRHYDASEELGKSCLARNTQQ